MSQGGGGGSTTRHIIEVMYQVTGLDKAGTGITSMNKSVTQGQTTLDKFGMSATKAATESTKLGQSVSKVPPAIDKTSQSTTKLDKSLNSTGDKAKSLGEKFRGNKGLIFSTTMLSSGVFEAIGMFQGWTDASEKLSVAQQKVADLEARGMENTKEYGDAVREAADAQRGFNFIQRFTIQSFADLIPMSLMMASSLIEMSGNFMKGATMKEKFAAASGKVVSGLKAVGSAMMTFTTRHPLLLLLTLLATAVVAVITNFGGFRDRLNEVGKALGDAVPGLKGVLDWLGQLGNGFAQSAEATMGYSQTTTKSLKDVESEVLRTGDATQLSIDEQIAMYGKLGDEAKDVAFSLSMHLKMQQDDQEAHKKKYAEFVSAMESGDQDIMKSMGLTEEQFKEFYKAWEQEIADFDTAFAAHVDTVVENYKKFEESGREAQESQGEELKKLEQKLTDHYNKREEIRDKEGKDQDEAMDKWEQEKDEILADIEAVSEGLSSMAIDARDDWHTFSTAGKEAMEQFKLEALGGNFQDAVETITTAMDDVPDKYKQNMGQAKSILENESLSMESRADIFVAHMDKLDPFQSFVVGAHEYTLEQARVASGLDELSVAARANVRDMDQMPAAWDKLVASLSPAQRELPIVKSAIEGVNSGAITQATAFGMIEAAGVKMSEQLGGTVTKTFEELQKTIVTMPDGTKQAFANIGGQVVSLGKISDTNLVSGANSVTNNLTATADETDYMAKTFAIQMPKASTEVETFQTDANSYLTGIIDTFKLVGTEAAKIPGLLKTALSTESIQTAWQGFRDALGTTGEWINTGITTIAAGIKGAITIEKFTDTWNGFWSAIAQGGPIIVSGIATLATTIANDIKAKAVSQQWWKGFWDALGSTAQWVGTGIGLIGKGIISTIQAEGPKWWVGFQQALGSTAQWVGTGITRVGQGITSTITSQGPKWWRGFQDALGSTAQWVGTGITRIGQGITSAITPAKALGWWKGFRDALANVSWVPNVIAKVGSAITSWFTSNATDIGTKIWNAIGGAIAAAAGGLAGIIDKIGGGKLFQDVSADKGEGKGVSLEEANKMMDQGFGGLSQKSSATDVKAAQAQWSNFSTSMAAYSKSIVASITAIQKAASTLSTSMSTYATSMKTTFGAFVTATTTSIGTLTPVITQLQTTFSTLSTTVAAYATSMLTTVGAWITGSITSMGAFMPVILQLQQTFSTLSMSIATYSTSMLTTIGAWITGSVTSIGAFIPVITTLQTTFSTLSTSVATYMTSMTTTIAAWITASTKSMGAFIQVITLTQKTFSTLSTSVATYMKSMTTNIKSFQTGATTSLGAAGKAATALQKAESDLSKNTATYTKSMTANLKSFSNSAVQSLKAVTSAANKATSALKAMAQAAAKAKAARSGLRFGGAFVTGGQAMNQSSFAQTGKSFINSRPRKIGGVNISEFSKPELVTVTPLSNPSDPMDKGLNYLDKLPAPKLQIPDMSNIGGGSGSNNNNNRPIKVELHTTVTMPDGRVLAKAVQQHLLEGFSGIT
jgi:hypothetical protein